MTQEQLIIDMVRVHLPEGRTVESLDTALDVAEEAAASLPAGRPRAIARALAHAAGYALDALSSRADVSFRRARLERSREWTTEARNLMQG